jgi:hypothetical protein
MNHNTVVSLPVSADLSAEQHKLVKMTSTGIALTTGVLPLQTDGTGEAVLGTLVRGNSAAANVGDAVIGRAASVHLKGGNGFHFVTLGAGITTAITAGALLEMDTTDGCVCLRTAAQPIGVAVDSAPSGNAGAIIRAILF